MKGPYIMTDKTSADLFSFEHDGKTYTFEQSFDVVRSPRWLRANRRRDELDFAFTIIEELAGDDALEAIDAMSEAEFEALSKKLNKELSKTFR
jgi:hypothetical protein